MSQNNSKKQDVEKKQGKKQPPKRKTLKGKMARFLLCLLFLIGAAGVGHFYLTEKRLPKNMVDAKVIFKNLSTFFIYSTNLVKEKWKDLGLDKKTKKILDGFERLIAKDRKKRDFASQDGKTNPKDIKGANIPPDPAEPHILKGREYFLSGQEYLHKFRTSRSQKDLDKAKKELQKSRQELEKAYGLTQDPERKKLIDAQLSEVGKLLSDCAKLGSM